MPNYTIQQGDTTSSVAYEHGFFWETIWNHPNNDGLRETRGNPNILYPGDVLFIPEKEEKQVSGSTEMRHRFRRKGVPETFKLRLLDENEEPRPDVPYRLEIDGEWFSGTSNADGIIEHPISPDAREGTLMVANAENPEVEDEYPLRFGHLDPIDEISGLQARLNNLGFYIDPAEIDGEMGPKTIDALKRFQREHDLEETGEFDDDTRQALENLHSS